MGVGRYIKRGLQVGALAGVLLASQASSLRDSYGRALDTAKYAAGKKVEAYETIIKQDKELKGNEIIIKNLEEAKKEYQEIGDRQEEYSKASDSKKAKMMVTDLRRFGLTAKSFRPAIPLYPAELKKTAKGGVKGIATGGVLGLGLGTYKGIRGWKKRRKK